MSKKVLFVCVENSCRSQMAEGFARLHGAGQVEAHSAGSKPSGKVNATAIAVMREKGVDLMEQHSKSLGDLPHGVWKAVVTMGCGDACPAIPAERRLDWALPDPKRMPLEEFRKVRDDIEARVKDLLAEISRA
ncbi:MAG: arsenate reductase ArsC [Elusimicrobiota bacterium]|nr:MAG: arsenate reductase ArsC [Elusimicrobiota bacterium]